MAKGSTRLLEKQQRSASDASSGREAGLADDHHAETGPLSKAAQSTAGGGVRNMFAVLDVHDYEDDSGHAEAADKEVAINSGLTAGQLDGSNN
jgi:hypothetical protein